MVSTEAVSLAGAALCVGAVLGAVYSDRRARQACERETAAALETVEVARKLLYEAIHREDIAGRLGRLESTLAEKLAAAEAREERIGGTIRKSLEHYAEAAGALVQSNEAIYQALLDVGAIRPPRTKARQVGEDEGSPFRGADTGAR